MNPIVFCGPSLRAHDIASYDGFEFRPPVRQGDLYAATRDRPRAIGVIDGYFDGQPAVLHKEILWALTQGIAIFGASSMGALRAAELHSFGMRGVGRIFEAYRDGELTDDDEVALIHGPPETGYIHLSEPMVNIRATLEQAVAEGIIDRPTGARLAASSKARFYRERTWPDVLADIGDHRTEQELATWLRTGKVDRKRQDGLELLKEMDAFIRSGAAQGPPDFHFEWTENWHNASWRNETAQPGGTAEEAAILDELRLRGDYAQLRREALLRLLARGEQAAPDRQAVKRAMGDFRSRRGLMRQTDVVDWARDNGMDLPGLDRMIEDDAAVETLARDRDAELHRAILDRLRELGLYPDYRDKALARQRAPSLSAPVPRALLAAWFFEKRLGRAVPRDIDDYAISIGLPGIEEFYDLLAHEYAFMVGRGSSDDSGLTDENGLT
ncbi:TfuA-like protein [Mesorhizobium humile]|uniref:TfuA-like protein n=1 Tax=Mesorhizobium humile TaxID=3072313 RepID=A0ABU4YQJ4_9HYPH|nr:MULTISPECIES: TfuA-like protein [unclassified Mesorhizobium]MDX8462674.1 TfuA-like protein [Mesorhizobium sp. VK2D]MDX8488184.1 TfuA-like protein [Mesorhizobium sp. VK2B]